MSAVRTACTATAAATTAAMAALVLAASPTAAAPLAAPPPDRPTSELLTELRGLYDEAGKATKAYQRVNRKLKKQRTEVARLNKQLSGTRSQLAANRAAAARLARRQYRDSTAGLTPYLRLLLSRDPHRALQQGYLLGRVAKDHAVTVRQLTGGERRLDRSADKAHRALERQRKLAKERKKQRSTARDRLEEVAELLASLDGHELARLRQLDGGTVLPDDGTDTALPDDGTDLPDDGTTWPDDGTTLPDETGAGDAAQPDRDARYASAFSGS